MYWQSIIMILVLLVTVLFIVVNPKIKIQRILNDSLKIYTNNKKNHGKIYWLDIMTFYICPVIIASITSFGFDYSFSKDSANTLVTVFAILFTLLFGIMSVLTAAIDNSNGIKKTISNEAYTTITLIMVMALIAIFGLIVYICIIDTADEKWLVFHGLTAIELFLSISIFLHFLMVIKRTYIVSQ